jgi:hypothetical protein
MKSNNPNNSWIDRIFQFFNDFFNYLLNLLSNCLLDQINEPSKAPPPPRKPPILRPLSQDERLGLIHDLKCLEQKQQMLAASSNFGQVSHRSRF